VATYFRNHWQLSPEYAIEHKPTSEKGYEALLIEPKGVPNTGDVESEMAIKKVEWI
jgi:hypothetical protein